MRRGQARLGQVVADAREQTWRRGQVVDPGNRFVVAQRRHQRAVAVGLGGVERDVGDALQEALPFVLDHGFLDVRLGVGLDHVQEGLLRTVVLADADDARRVGQIAGDVARIHRGQELAHRKVAAAAKENEVEIGKGHGGIEGK